MSWPIPYQVYKYDGFHDYRGGKDINISIIHKCCRLIPIPPKAVPFQVRPVTSWKGRVEISCPAAATPIIVDTPQPLWQDSKAAL